MNSIRRWLHKNFIIKDIIKDEFTFSCPVCFHQAFYFNVRKKLGFCHRATCRFSPTLNDLTIIVGNNPEDDIGGFFVDEEPPETQLEITLPTSDPVAYYGDNRKIFSKHPKVVDILMKQRGLFLSDILKWDLHTDGRKIYVPVYEKGKLVSYVGRIIWGLDLNGEKKYKYPSGINITQFLFGWDEAQHWNHLTLVENTFNSISYREKLNCSTNFGSHLNRIQINKISLAPFLKTVVLLWDENTDEVAEKAVKKLRRKGLNAIYCKILGQPDDHSIQELKEYIDIASKCSLKGKLWVNFR